MTPIEEADADELWKAQIRLEHEALEHIESLIVRVETKLDTLAMGKHALNH